MSADRPGSEGPATRQPDAALRNDYLANERTYLAWWRTALAAVALAIGIGRALPVLLDTDKWPFVMAGSIWAVLGGVVALYGLHRHRAVARAIADGGYAHASSQALAILSGVCAGLAVLAVALIVAVL